MATWLGSAVAIGADSKATALQAVTQALTKMGHQDQLKLVIVYAWPLYDLQQVIATIRAATQNAPLIGCTSAGEFTEQDYVIGGIAVTTIASDKMQVNLGYATQFTDDLPAAVKQGVSGFSNTLEAGLLGRTLLLFTDALVGHGEALIDEIMLQTDMQYQLFGAAAADDVKFQKTQVFINDQVLSNAFVCAQIQSEKPFSIAARHGWQPLEGAYRVTRSEGAILHELNGESAWSVYQQFAQKHDLEIVAGSESSFLMQFILGIEEQGKQYKLRVPLGVNADGSLVCAAEIPEGSKVYIMKSEHNGVVNGGKTAIAQAQLQNKSESLAGALVCECIATRLQLGDQFADEVRLTASALDSVQLMGLASYGQLARTLDEFSGLGCATSLVCLIPD